ncbi:hypothetical protein ATANTOWER_020122 [Ataeniobius toweri]|uniref:Uncharacterized protein n=1 Tax=Ataeniobius toweri TaxID=208326 RepID=A0ABU7B1D2_9TELE|nr:hypothetical protein [Ataeniobius toweri]
METSFLSFMVAENNQIWKNSTAVHMSSTSHLFFSRCLSLMSPSPMRSFGAESDDPDGGGDLFREKKKNGPWRFYSKQTPANYNISVNPFSLGSRKIVPQK